MDDLLRRRETLFSQQEQISGQTFLMTANVAELCAATGKFFGLLEMEPEQQRPPARSAPGLNE